MAGMEASMMTSLGTCRLVMPRSESTIASGGPVGQLGLEGRLDLVHPSGSASRPLKMAPSPSFGLKPAASSTSP